MLTNNCITVIIWLMHRIEDLAEVSQGIARSGRGAGARSGAWRVRIAESGDVWDSCWLETAGLKGINLVHKYSHGTAPAAAIRRAGDSPSRLCAVGAGTTGGEPDGCVGDVAGGPA